MKIGVERDDNLGLAPRVLHDLVVGGRRHPDIAHMRRVEPVVAQLRDGAPRQPLIEQELHALLGSSASGCRAPGAAMTRWHLCLLECSTCLYWPICISAERSILPSPLHAASVAETPGKRCGSLPAR